MAVNLDFDWIPSNSEDTCFSLWLKGLTGAGNWYLAQLIFYYWVEYLNGFYLYVPFWGSISYSCPIILPWFVLEYYGREVARDQKKSSDCTMIYKMVIIFSFDV